MEICVNNNCTDSEREEIKNLLKSISSQTVNKFKYPCYTCIVRACCTSKCNTILKYMNNLADSYEEFSSSDFLLFLRLVPHNRKREIIDLHNTRTRYSLYKS